MPSNWLRPAILVLAATQLILGLAPVVAPGTFYDLIADFGPRGDHYLRDTATISLAAAVALFIAAGRPSWRAPVLFVVGLQLALHAVNHVADVGDAESTAVGVFDAVSLALGAVLVFGMMRAAAREEVHA